MSDSYGSNVEGKDMAKRGRPALPEHLRKKKNLTFRTRGDLREKLADAADKSGCSINAEIERRLLASFQASDLAAVVRDAVRDGMRAFEPGHSLMDNLSNYRSPYAAEWFGG